jgi:YVTN family beta-propeller protein
VELKVKNARYTAPVLVVWVTLAACSTPNGTMSSVALPRAVAALNASGNGHLYVANAGGDTIAVYALSGPSKRRTISKGILSPLSLAFDRSGNLYVANCGGCFEPSQSSVTVYAAGTNAPSATITDGVRDPTAVAFDSGGNLYVANSVANDVTVYAPGSTRVTRTISKGVVAPARLVFDAAGNLYVANGNDTVTVYGSGSRALKRTISDDVNSPYAMAFDRQGRLYVGNIPHKKHGKVEVYAADGKALVIRGQLVLRRRNRIPGCQERRPPNHYRWRGRTERAVVRSGGHALCCESVREYRNGVRTRREHSGTNDFGRDERAVRARVRAIKRKAALKDLTPNASRFAAACAYAQNEYFGVWIGRVRFACGFTLCGRGKAGSLRFTATSGIIARRAAFDVKVVFTKTASRHVDSFRSIGGLFR